MLNELNKEQEDLIEKISNEWINEANGGETCVNKSVAIKALHEIYAIADMASPNVLFFDGPMEAIIFCRKELKQNIQTVDWFGVGYDAGWVSFYDYFQRIGVLEKDEEGFNTIKNFMRSGVWSTILFENIALCISRPCIVKTNEKGDLHCANGPAIAFNDGYKEYLWNGIWVDEKLIMRPKEITREDIMNEKNSEVSRAIAEKLGWEEYMKRAEVFLVDKWFDTSKNLHYELWDFKKRFELTPRLLKMESPELNDGTRPYYVEPVHPSLKTCQAARKWQFLGLDGKWPEPEECNKNQTLEFEFEA